MNYTDIIKLYKKGEKINLGLHNFNVLPFNTRAYRLLYRNGFSGIIGELSRIIEGYNYSETDISERLDFLIKKDEVEISENNIDEFKSMLKSFKPIKIGYTFDSIKMLKYIPLSGSTEVTGIHKDNKEEIRKEKDFANFIYYNLLQQNASLKNIYSSEVKTDVLTKLFYKIYNLEKNEKENIKYIDFNSNLLKIIYEDLEFLMKKEKIFLSNYEQFLAFYLFVYSVEVACNIDIKKSSSNIYWFFDDEKASKARRASTINWKAYKGGALNRCYINLLCMDIANNITKSQVETPSKVYESIENPQKFKRIVEEISILLGFEMPVVSIMDTKEIYLILFDQLEKYYTQGKQSGSLNHYVSWFEDLGKKYFLKQRGRYGYTFNLTEKTLLLLITIIVKEHRIKLKDFFIELEKRHVYCDANTQKSIVNTIEKLGLLEKKSDSGDAQYIKSIIERV